MARRDILIVVMAVVALALNAVPAWADVAIGAGMAIFAGLGVLLMPGVVIIEAIVARRVFRVSVGQSLLVALVANFASAFFGAVVAEFLLPPVRTRNTGGLGVFLAASPLLFFTSVVIEIPIAKRLVPDARDRALRWGIEANLISYAMMAAFAALLWWLYQIPQSLWFKWGLI